MPATPPHLLSSAALASGALVWAAAVTCGLAWLARYACTPGPAAGPLAAWPIATRLTRDAARPTVVVFLHPRCPCSRATLGELAEVVARSEGRVHAIGVFTGSLAVVPGEGREEPALQLRAREIASLELRFDVEGAEARRFSAETSGETFLYAAEGRLLFRGGLTRARGHEGRSVGRDAVLTLVAGGAAPTHTPVFGCRLREPPRSVQ